MFNLVSFPGENHEDLHLRLMAENEDLKRQMSESQEERNVLVLKTEILLDMLAVKTAENDKLIEQNAQLRAIIEQRLKQPVKPPRK